MIKQVHTKYIKLKDSAIFSGSYGVSELIGTLLLLIISVSLFSVLFTIVFSISPPTEAPDTQLVFSYDDNNITISHLHGISLNYNSKIKFEINDYVFSENLSDLPSDWDENSDSKFNVGEKIVYNPSVKNLLQKNISMYLIDQDSNTIVTSSIQYDEPIVTTEKPILSKPYPSFNSRNVELNETLGITVFDANLENVTVYWLSNISGGSFINMGSETGKNKRYYFTPTDFNSYNTMYYWKVEVSDGENLVTSPIYKFKTKSEIVNNPPNQPTDPIPTDSSTDISNNPTLSVTVTDPDGDIMDVTFYNASDDSIIGTDTDVSNGGTASVIWSGLSNGSSYSWYAIANDSVLENSSSTWTFTTQSYESVMTVEFEDSFENGEWNDLWEEDSNNDWSIKDLFDYPYPTDGDHFAQADGKASDSTITMKYSIDLSGKNSALLNFSWYIYYYWKSGYYLKLEIYDGSNWNVKKYLNSTVWPPWQWHDESIDLSSYLINDFKIRFSANLKNGYYGCLDDIKITSYS